VSSARGSEHISLVSDTVAPPALSYKNMVIHVLKNVLQK
jgi:hypothetical protein